VAHGSTTTADPSDYFVVHLDPGESLRLRLASQTPGTPLELYVRYAAIPSRLGFDQRAASPAATQEITLTGIASGAPYYVEVYGDRGATNYALVAEQAPFFVTDAGPKRHGIAATAHVTLTGAGFDETTHVRFINQEGVPRPIPTEFVSPTTLIATIDFGAGLPPGNPKPFSWAPGVYSIEVEKGSRQYTLPNAFEVL